MASVSAFNDMLAQFLTELQRCVPEEKGISKFQTQFDMLRQANPRKCVDAYMAGIAPYAEKISSKDDTFITEDLTSIDFLKDLNIKEHWSEKLSDNTKGAIWQYLQTLYMLGTTIVAIPQETLSQIETLAKSAASQMEDSGSLNQDALMKTMSNMLGGMLNK
jgi:hypothetical protein